MPTAIDPEERETRELLRTAEFRRARVLEIGCGAGRLTRRYADRVELAAGLDPDWSALHVAQTGRSPGLARRIAYVQGLGFTLPFLSAQFDVVLFGWSL